jgi:5-methylcytosine-specific restriction endonuclease McrA
MAATLKLNADGNPVSVLPLSTMTWKEAITDMLLDKITVLEWHEDWIIHSANWQTRVPSVVMLKNQERRKQGLRFSKFNIFLRDEYRCQYCGIETTRKTATLDHVLPISHGGKNTWENCVCACSRCNIVKGNNKKIVPKQKPYKPNYYQLVEKCKKTGWNVPYTVWLNYLG